MTNRVVKSETRNGRQCKHDGTTLKYVSNGNCVDCSIRKSNERTNRMLDEKDRQLHERLKKLPTFQLRIERPLRVPLVILIPKPPVSIVNVRWL